ncbi:DUF2064 domain-containing protein [Emticicia sp. SJ17W-69]|uniref:DUF2064 domain-containing protein n=1 Tax=Emticicia sp. SJ17W-69 TaxID=3421657 RepID=UPI003EB6F268
MKNATSILIFIQDVSKDASLKTLTPSKNTGVNRLVFNQLNSFVGRTARSTGLSVFYSNQLIDDHKNGFGKQLSLSIQAVFEKGFEYVICIGNDCPALSKVQILDAAEKLKTVNTVLGPDQRGGVYLLAVSKNTFDAQVFENLAWKSGMMLTSYLKQFAQQKIFFLESLSDIHTFEELQNYSLSRYFIRFLLQLIEKSTAKKISIFSYLFDNQVIRLSSLRAPPAY